MINKAVLIGRITKDLEMRRTANGNAVVSFTLAVGRNKVQEGQQEADFINCVAWNKTADLMYQYLHKGSLIGVEGRIQTRNYDNQQGQRVFVTEVIVDSVQFLDSRNAQQSQPQQTYQQPQQPQYAGSLTASAEAGAWQEPDISSDDLPF